MSEREYAMRPVYWGRWGGCPGGKGKEFGISGWGSPSLCLQVSNGWLYWEQSQGPLPHDDAKSNNKWIAIKSLINGTCYYRKNFTLSMSPLAEAGFKSKSNILLQRRSQDKRSSPSTAGFHGKQCSVSCRSLLVNHQFCPVPLIQECC